jgi:hypothetical protein
VDAGVRVEGVLERLSSGGIEHGPLRNTSDVREGSCFKGV